MIAAIWRKHWMELWRRWLLVTAFGLLPAVLVAVQATGRQGSRQPDVGSFLVFFAVLVWTFFPTRFGSTGLTSSSGARPCSGASGTDSSILFTLSLPVRRRTLFFCRSVSGLLAMETATAVAWAISGLLLVHMGASWHALAPALWLPPALVPMYFLDSLLLTRFSEMTTMQIQAFTVVGVWFSLQRVLGSRFVEMMEFTLRQFASLPAALAVCLLSAAFAATTVWRVDRQSY